ncbi:MAG: hypothetical protein KBF37_00985 [Saprospiraceae bacterium]|jgi:hypothetical protein|nr:hypothetical protein [Saprospiraceae bacterium]MBP9208869.1 hypothetical protein [Saprospiraceae bacterium]
MEQISFSYPAWMLVPCLLLALGIAALVYQRSQALADKGVGAKWLLFALRATAAFLLLLLLLNPIFKLLREEFRRPVLVIAQDVSKSLETMRSEKRQEYLQARNAMESALSEKYELVRLEFGERVETTRSDSFVSSYSNLSSVLDHCMNNLDLRTLNGVIFASDGIYNQGKNPLYHPLLTQLPLFPVLLGDSSVFRDLSLANLYHSEIIHSGDPFAVQVDVKARNCSGEPFTLAVSEYSEGTWKKVAVTQFTINSTVFFQTAEFVLQSKVPGIYRYRLEATQLAGEKNTANNFREFFIEVLETKARVLIWAHSPHPDVAAIRNALSGTNRYSVDVLYSYNKNIETANYQLVILHQMPSSSKISSALMNSIQEGKIPSVFITGEATDVTQFNAFQGVLRISNGNRSVNEVTPHTNPDFKSFTQPEGLTSFLQRSAPLNCLFGTYETHPSATVFLYQKIGKVETQYPLWVLSDMAGQRRAFILGTGLWKWRLSEFGSSNRTQVFDELISKTVQYAITKSDDRRLRVNSSKSIYPSGEQVFFTAEFYNDNLERINQPDLHLEITDEGKSQYPFVFSKTENYYTLGAGSFSPGSYQYSAKVNWNQKEYRKGGRFSVSSFDLERAETTADFELLRNLADKSGGQAFAASELEQLTSVLLQQPKSKSTMYFNIDFIPLIDIKWVFVAIFILFATEWFLRRFWGSY